MDYPEEEIARSRADFLAELQSRVIDDWNEAQFDNTLEVLVEDFDGNEYYGRTYADSPGIDGQVRVTSEEEHTPGDFVLVKILGAEDGDLIGREADEQ